MGEGPQLKPDSAQVRVTKEIRADGLNFFHRLLGSFLCVTNGTLGILSAIDFTFEAPSLYL